MNDKHAYGMLILTRQTDRMKFQVKIRFAHRLNLQ